jgi:DNA polymerase II small subunit/DNA polymerase delta subunit B
LGWQDDLPYGVPGTLRDALMGEKLSQDDITVPPRAPALYPPQAGGGGGPEQQPDMARDRPRFRAIFISDLHLGTPGCQAGALLEFLREHNSESLYLIGDIVDGWQLRRRWYWPQSHNDVVQKLLRQARKGCRVVFVPGNHDEFARGFLGNSFGGAYHRRWAPPVDHPWRLL